MSSIVGYNVVSTYPRIFVRATDKTAITARTDSTSSWKTYWDNRLTPYITTLKGQTDATICAVNGNSYSRFMCLGLWGWIENDTAAHTKLLSAAKYLAQTTGIWSSWTQRRYQVLCLAYAYNFLRTGVITFAAADRKIIGDALMSMTTGGTNDTQEFLDGHSAGNYMAYFIAAATLYGESGSGYDYTAAATTKMDAALGFWFGDITDDVCHMDSWRYFGDQGAHWMGASYTQIGGWKMSFMLNAMQSALTDITLDSVAYDPIADESWIEKIGEFFLHIWMRGDDDYFTVMDTARVVEPWVHDQMRQTLGFLITNGGTYRKPLRWMLDTLNAKETVASYAPIHDVLFYDPADADNASLPPQSTSIARTFYANPPGTYFYRSTWDYKTACVVQIECPERYFQGHSHLNRGSIQIAFKDDMVLGHSGLYRTSDANANFNGPHHHYYYQQSIACSGVPLCDDGTYVHYAYNELGSWFAYPTALGGQTWKMDGTTKDAYDVDELTTAGGGESWLAAEMTRPVTATDDYDFVVCDVQRAYVRDYTELGGATERIRACKIKYLIIKRETDWPIVLRVMTMESRLAAMEKRDVWHSYGQWTLSDAANGARRGTAQGYRGVGKVVIDLYNPSDFDVAQVGGGTLDGSGYAAQQFYYDGTNYPPSNPCPARYLPDLCRYRLEHVAANDRTEETFVQLLMPMGIAESPPEYTWIDNATWFGVRFTASGTEYKIAKATDTVAMTAGEEEPEESYVWSSLVVTRASAVQMETSYLVEGQAKAEITINEALNRLDATIMVTVKDRDLTTPPSSPSAGDRYIVPAGASGVWTDQEDNIAVYYGGWVFLTPKIGWQAWIEDEGCWAVYTTSWESTEAVADLSQSITNPPTQAEVEAIQTKVNALLAQLRVAGALKT